MSTHLSRSFFLTLIAVLFWGSTRLAAQCLDWRAFPNTPLELKGAPYVLHVHDDGSGPALYVGGDLPSPAGGSLRLGVRRWNGTNFSDLAGGLDKIVYALTTFDDGSGPALFAGTSTGVSKWNGSSWQTIVTANSAVKALVAHDDGSGPALFAGGSFTTLGSLSANCIAKWNGTTWSALSTGLTVDDGAIPEVLALAVYDEGNGPKLFAGGEFHRAGGILTRYMARWEGSAWSAMPPNVVLSPVRDLCVYDDGSGPKLFAASLFTFGTGMSTSLALWDGVAWSAMGIPSYVSAQRIGVVDEGSGNVLYAVSQFGVQRYDGTTWTSLSSTGPISTFCSPSGPVAFAIGSFDEGSGPHPFVGGTFSTLDFNAGATIGSLQRRANSTWQTVGNEPVGLGGPVRALATFDDGSGAALYAGGSFCSVDDTLVWGQARLTTTGWQSFLSSGPFDSFGLADLGTGPALYTGTFNSLKRWDGATWNFVGASDSATGQGIFAIHGSSVSGTPEVYVGGVWTYFGSVLSTNIGRFDGTTWRTVGGGVDGAVLAFAEFDDGSGLALYAGGTFTHAGGVPMNYVARWNGTNWSAVGAGLGSHVYALHVHDDGSGPALYAGGNFGPNHVARWNGSAWTPVGSSGPNGLVTCLTTFDDGTGPKLVAGGAFTSSGATPTSGVARWNGTSWSGLGSGANGTVWALAPFDDGTGLGPALYIGGEFTQVATKPSAYLAAWRSCGGTISKFCFGDGSVAACPCGNQGAPSRGCNNSQGTGGARLNGTGTTVPDTLELYVAGEGPSAATLFFQGDVALTAPVPFGDGLRCVGGAVKRLYTLAATNGAASVPGPGQPSISARSAALGDALTPGTVRFYQTWYRDPNPTFCATPQGNLWNLSNAVRVAW